MDGRFLIGAKEVSRPESFRAYDPASDRPLEPDFSVSRPSDIAEACRLAAEAFDAFRETVPEARAAFLEAAAGRIEALGETLIERAIAESGLPRARLTGELGRTTGQLRLFARVVREGRWAGVTFDAPLPERRPAPRPDLRQRRIGIGPVAVFGASNFPLAFSVGGGDTAAALAAGCPVVVKGHPAHPGASVLVGRAIRDAVAECGLPEGVFSLVQGPGEAQGAALVADPRIRAVAFTGSRGGGFALMKIAQARPSPIPVFAEMSSVNPVILMPGAAAARAEEIGRGFAGSLTLGAGQFCTNPGLVLGVMGPDLDRVMAAAAAALAASEPQVMLTPRIHSAYGRGLKDRAGRAGVETIAMGPEAREPNRAKVALFAVESEAFRRDLELAEELFGAASLVVRCRDLADIAEVLEGLEGQLTATLQLEPSDYDLARPLLPILERRAGRILANGWPTGVEVSYAMVHGGPFPATSDPRSTSVGAAAIERFLRPICYQDVPEALLPTPVRSDNPLNLPRLINAR